MKKTEESHNWKKCPKTLFDKCKHCSVLKRKRPIFKHGNWHASKVIIEYSLGNNEWIDKLPVCKKPVKLTTKDERKTKTVKTRGL